MSIFNSPQKIRLLVLAGAFAISLHFAILFSADAIRYFSLSMRAPVKIKQWEIIPIKKKFGIEAQYTFEAGGRIWEGLSRLMPPYHLNEWAALNALKIKAKEPWQAWYNKNHPNLSELEKEFPVNLLIRCLISWGVSLYFLFYPKLVLRRA